jgi:hypothetical protein
MDDGPPFAKANWNVTAKASQEARRMMLKLTMDDKLMYLWRDVRRTGDGQTAVTSRVWMCLGGSRAPSMVSSFSGSSE